MNPQLFQFVAQDRKLAVDISGSMAKYDKFPVFIKELEGLNKRKTRLLRKELTPIAESFNKKLINWLQGKQYPLRGGELDADPGGREEWDGRTATQRLHGEETLALAQMVRIRKKYGENTLSVIYENVAPHAQYFFPEIEPHTISGNPFLYYWAGEPMAWHPPVDVVVPEGVDADEIWGGIRKRDRVDHPGHMDYGEFFFKRFQRSKESKQISKVFDAVMAGLSKEMRDAL